MNALNSFIKLPILLSVFALFTCASCKENTIDIPNVNNGIVFNPNLSYGSVTDIDGNTYKTITIGDQTWMAQNLRTTKYSNGDIISNVKSNSEWTSINSGAQCSFRNGTNTDSIAKFGRLYNWYAASDKRNIAPTGWHVSSEADWTLLEYYLISKGYYKELGTSGGGVSQSLVGTTDWQSGIFTKDLSSNNTTGFTALPNGRRTNDFGTDDIGFDVTWWCSTNKYVSMLGTYRLYKVIAADDLDKRMGCAIRCVKNNISTILTTTIPSAIVDISAISGGVISSDGGSSIIARGICWSSTDTYPTIADNKTSNGVGIGSFTSNISGLTANTTYYVRAYATTNKGTDYGFIEKFTTYPAGTNIIKDIQGNEYHALRFGNKTWMLENLKTTKYRNGDFIPNVIANANWGALKSGAWCFYNNDTILGLKYGNLYNWFAVNDSRNLAPVGWHVATASDWILLSNSINELKGGDPYEWNNSSFYSSFNALPGGSRGNDTGLFGGLNYSASFWCSDIYKQSGYSYSVILGIVDKWIPIASYSNGGRSVRCVKD